MPNTNDRQFSYADPVLYNGSLFPSATANISDSGSSRVGRVFASADGQYYYLNDSGTPVPAMLSNTLPEVTVTPSPEDMLASAFARRSTLSNDKTQVANTPHRPYNPHLSDNALRGAKEHGLWEQQNPNAAAWGNAAAAAPFAVAAAPFVMGAGQAAAGTALGQTAINKLSAFMSTPLMNMVNTAAGLGFAVKGGYDMTQGKFTPETALDVAGGLPLALMGGLKLGRTIRKNIQAHKKFPLAGETEIPINIKQEAAERYADFINSQEYQNRMKEAGLENRWNDVKELTKERVNGENHFPGHVKPIIDYNPKALGITDTFPFSPDYGITLKESLSSKEINPVLNHEISHWATKNAEIEDKGFLGDIMRYNEDIAPNIPWEDIYRNYPPSTPIPKVMEKEKGYVYLTDPQEKRARAYAIYQEAKDRKMSTDELVDLFTENGKISKDAPEQLYVSGQVMSPNDIKKYLNKFLTLSIPIGVGVTIDKVPNE